MKISFGYYLLIFIAFLIPKHSFATHVMGAEFEWEETGKDTFLIKVNVYRDCNGINLSATPITAISSCGSIRLNTTRSSGEDVTPICDEQCSRCDSRSCSFQYGIEKYELSAIFIATSPIGNGCCDFTLSWQQCCRNGSITTGSASENFYLESKIDVCKPTQLKWNSPAVAIGCLGKDLYLDLSIDHSNADDSVVYKWAEPMQSANSKSSYTSPFAYNKPISYLGFPKTGQSLPRGIHLDKDNGSLRFRPMKAEQTIMAIKAEVYRKQTLVASITRDIQYTVIKCPDNSPPRLSGFDTTSFAAKSFKKTICANKMSHFKLYSYDNDKDDSVLISFNSGVADSVIITDKKDKRQMAEWFWTPTSNDISEQYHEFKLDVIDDACPVSLQNSAFYKIKVISGLPKGIDISSETLNNCGSYAFKIQDSTGFDFSNVKWFLNDTLLIGDKKSVSYTFNQIGKFKISAIISECDTLEISDSIDVINAKTLAIALNDTASCGNKTITLKPKVIGNVGPVTYNWDIDTAFGYAGSLNDSVVDIDLQKISGSIKKPISLTVKDSLNCEITKEITLNRKPTDIIDIETSRVLCYGDVERLTLSIRNGYGSWTGPNLTNNEIKIEDLNFSKYLYAFVYEDDYICELDTFILDYKKLPTVSAGVDINTCLSSDNETLSPSPVNGIWNNSTYIKQGKFDHKQAGKGNYSLIYSFTDIYGCQNEDTINVNIYDYAPTVLVTDTAEACLSEQQITLSADKNGGTWSGTGILSSANPLIIKPSDLGSGTWPIYYNFSDSNKCSSIDTSTIIINEAPIININIENSSIDSGDTLKVNNNTVAQNPVTYHWKLGNPAFITSTTENFSEVVDSVGTFDLTLMATDEKTDCVDTLVLEDAIVVGNGNSISELDKSISVFPNPFNDEIQINSDRVIETVKVFNANGQLVSYKTPNKNLVSIDLETQAKGMYFIRIYTEKGTFSKRILKQ
ncbi:MAG: T9SS type A sorting domain-containing protein [Bacteroidia bacterium]